MISPCCRGWFLTVEVPTEFGSVSRIDGKVLNVDHSLWVTITINGYHNLCPYPGMMRYASAS